MPSSQWRRFFEKGNRKLNVKFDYLEHIEAFKKLQKEISSHHSNHGFMEDSDLDIDEDDNKVDLKKHKKIVSLHHHNLQNTHVSENADESIDRPVDPPN